MGHYYSEMEDPEPRNPPPAKPTKIEAERAALGLPRVPDPIKGDMDVVANLQKQHIAKAFETETALEELVNRFESKATNAVGTTDVRPFRMMAKMVVDQINLLEAQKRALTRKA